RSAPTRAPPPGPACPPTAPPRPPRPPSPGRSPWRSPAAASAATSSPPAPPTPPCSAACGPDPTAPRRPSPTSRRCSAPGSRWAAPPTRRTSPPRCASWPPATPATSPHTTCGSTAGPPPAEAVQADHEKGRTVPHHPTSPSSLLAAYAPGMSLIATPERTLLGEGALDTTDDLARVPEMLRGVRDAGWHRDPVAIGAVPFAPAAPAHLTVPAAVHTAPPLASARDAAEAAERRALPGPWKAEALPEPEEHRTAVQRAVQSLGPDLEKVVLARSLRLVGPGPVDAAQVLRNLAWRDPAGFTFAMNLPPRTELPGPRTFIGASPELLVAKRGGRALSNPLAGSRPRSADATKDQHNAVELLGSAKDRREHALVVDAVAEGLRPFCTRLDVPGEPELIRTATMWHLSTRV